tara:strand:- start:904 stop:1638 length:735 start_codon:yes stop_codon:yes gene_type:complete
MVADDDATHAKRTALQACTHDLSQIRAEFPTADVYDTDANLEALSGRLEARVGDAGFEVIDATARLNGVSDALHLARLWAELVHEARTAKIVQVLRRTPANSDALLTLQRMEHLRGACNETTPLAVAVLMRGEQALYPRDEVGSAARLDDELTLRIRSNVGDCPICGEFIHSGTPMQFTCGHQAHAECYARLAHVTTSPACPACVSSIPGGQRPLDRVVANMPEAAYTKQLEGIALLLEHTSVE